MDNGRKLPKPALSAAFAASAVWFGSHCGSGFCTGTAALSYFVSYGWTAVWSAAIPFVFLALFAYLMGEYARRVGAKSYKDIAATIYTSNKTVSSVLVLCWDLLAVLVVFMSVGSCLAAAGSLLEEILGLNYFLGTVLTAVIIVVIDMYGPKMMTKLSTPLVYIMVVCIVIICVAVLRVSWGDLTEIVRTKETFGAETTDHNIGRSILSALNYVSLQSAFCSGAWLPLMGVMASSRDVKAASIFGGLLNGIMLVLVSVTVLSQMPEAAGETLPIYSIIVKYYGTASPLCLIYELALFLAILTTGTVSTYNATARYSDLFYNSKLNREKKYSEMFISALVAAVLLLCTILIAQLGLRTIVGKGFTIVATIRAPLALSAGFIFAPIRLWQIRRTEGRAAR